MKLRNKLLFGLIALSPVLTACSETEELLSVSDDAITFGTYIGKSSASRAVVTDDEGLKEVGFGVFAYYTAKNTWETVLSSNTQSPNFMSNQQVYINNGNWYYSPLKYWPKSKTEKISYFAYAPYSTNNVTVTNGIPVISYNIVKSDTSLDGDRMCDLVIASDTDICTENHPDRTVKFGFEHTLSRIAIMAEASENIYVEGSDHNRTKVYITSMQVKGLYGSGDLDLVTGEWSNKTIADVIDLTSQLNRSLTSFQKEDGRYINGCAVTSTTAESVFKNANYLFVLPQDATDDLTFAFTYNIVTEDDAIEGGYVAQNTVSAEVEVKKSFLRSVAHTITFKFGLNSVEFDTTTNNWSNNENSGENNGENNGENSGSGGTGNEVIDVTGVYYLHRNEAGWDYDTKYMFTSAGNGEYTLTVDENPQDFFILKKQSIYEYTEIYGLSYTNLDMDNYAFDFNTTYNIEKSENTVSWGLHKMELASDAAEGYSYKFTFNPSAQTLVVTQVKSSSSSSSSSSTITDTNSAMSSSEANPYGVSFSDLKQGEWHLAHNNYWETWDDNCKFTDLGNGLFRLKISRLYSGFEFHAQVDNNTWKYALANIWAYQDKLQMGVPHKLAISVNTGGTMIQLDGADYVDDANIILDFTDTDFVRVTITGTPGKY